MKRKLTIICLITILMISAAPGSIRPIRLTIVNKSGLEVALSLTGDYSECSYYLRVPKGSRSSPIKKEFTIIPDYYDSTLYYIELWDPVYGYRCESQTQTLDLRRNTQVLVVECDRTPRGGEAPAFIKYGAPSKGAR